MLLFHIEKRGLYFKPAGVSGKAAVFSHNAMARDDHWNWVRMVCHAHGPGRPMRANRGGYFRVGAGFSIGYIHKCPPDFKLKGCACGTEREFKFAAHAGEILHKLIFRRIQQWILRAMFLKSAEYYPDYISFTGRDAQQPYR